MIQTCVAGCDISSRWLDLCILSSSGTREMRLENDAAGQAAVLAALHHAAAGLVVIEASGGYEAGILAACWAAGQPVALVSAGRVRHFARADGQMAKTDRIDAQVLALFAARMQPEPTPPMSESRRYLKGLVGRRRTLVTLRAEETKRLKQTALPRVQVSLRAHIAWLDTAIDALKAEIKTAIQTCRDSAARVQVMRSMPGIGPTTAAVLLAELPELGTIGPRQIAALAGLAPHPRQSGSWKGRRFISGGRKPVRDALYMAATTTVFRSTTSFANTYNRLRNAGKPHKLALVAVMRKMIVTLNAMIKQNQKFAE